MATASGLRFGTGIHAGANALPAKELTAHATTAFLVLPATSGPTTTTANAGQLLNAKPKFVSMDGLGVIPLATVFMVELDQLAVFKEVVHPRLLMEQVKEELTDPVQEAQMALLMVQVVAVRMWEVEILLTRVFQLEIENDCFVDIFSYISPSIHITHLFSAKKVLSC